MMAKPTYPVPLDDEEPGQPHYTSFILRCWIGEGGEIKARLIEVHSGVSRPVADLDRLPALVQRRMARMALSAPQIEHHSKGGT